MAIEPDENFETASKEKMEELRRLKTLSYEETSKLVIPRLEEIDITIAEFKKELPNLITTVMWDIEEDRRKKEQERLKDLKDKRDITIGIWKRRLGIGTAGGGLIGVVDIIVRLFVV